MCMERETIDNDEIGNVDRFITQAPWFLHHDRGRYSETEINTRLGMARRKPQNEEG